MSEPNIEQKKKNQWRLKQIFLRGLSEKFWAQYSSEEFEVTKPSLSHENDWLPQFLPNPAIIVIKTISHDHTFN